MQDPMSYQGDSVTLSPYGITHMLNRLPFGVGIGDKFTGREIEGTITVLLISQNELLVEIVPGCGSAWREVWNLEHTIVGFRNGIYKKVLTS